MDEPDAFFGPQINETQHKKILDLFEIAKKEGAEALTGGNAIDRDGNFVQPTVFGNAKQGMEHVTKEIFGPVTSIIKFGSFEEGIDMANDTNYGLTAGVFTKNMGQALRATNRIQAGTISVNDFAPVDPRMPFGGYKESGIGRTLGCDLGTYLETKHVTIAYD